MTNELSNQEAAFVKAMLIEGYKNQDIAALYGVNPRAVSQVKNKECYPLAKPNFDHGFSRGEITTSKAKLINELRRLRK